MSAPHRGFPSPSPAGGRFAPQGSDRFDPRNRDHLVRAFMAGSKNSLQQQHHPEQNEFQLAAPNLGVDGYHALMRNHLDNTWNHALWGRVVMTMTPQPMLVRRYTFSSFPFGTMLHECSRSIASSPLLPAWLRLTKSWCMIACDRWRDRVLIRELIALVHCWARLWRAYDIGILGGSQLATVSSLEPCQLGNSAKVRSVHNFLLSFPNRLRLKSQG